MRELAVHAAFSVLWLGLAFGLAIKIALLGSEQATLARNRGADLKARTELAYQNDRLRAAIDFAASPAALSAAVRRLDLPLQPAQVPRASDPLASR